jgi:putative two-component system response regulator
MPTVIGAGSSAEGRRVIGDMLSGEPWHLVWAAGSDETIELIDRAGGDLLLVEAPARDLDGFELCRRLRKDDRHALLPIVIISGKDDIASRVAALEAGADDVLSKPIEANELVARVRSLLRLNTLRERMEDVGQVIMSLAKAAEAKDHFTQEHTERVADAAFALATKLDLPGDLIEQIRFGALVHDIGKVAIPASVLNKPGALDSREFETMKSHTLIGAKIVEPLATQRHVVAIVRGHHERFDGKGYPDGLAGDAIPIEARIVSVCDAYDAMVSRRPYRLPLPQSEAIARLRAGRDSQWDAEVVDVFIDSISSTNQAESKVKQPTARRGAVPKEVETNG